MPGPGSGGVIPGPQYGRRNARALAREEEFLGPNVVGGMLGPWLAIEGFQGTNIVGGMSGPLLRRRDSRAPMW